MSRIHAGSIHKAGTQCERMYYALSTHCYSSRDLCIKLYIANPSAILSSVNAQLPNREVMVMRDISRSSNRCHYMFRIFKSKTEAKKYFKGRNMKWRFWGEK